MLNINISKVVCKKATRKFPTVFLDSRAEREFVGFYLDKGSKKKLSSRETRWQSRNIATERMFLLKGPQNKVKINWSEPGPLQGISTVIDKSSLFHFLTLWYTLGYSSEHTHLPNQEFGYRTFDCLPVTKAFPFHFTTLFIRNIEPTERLDLNSILRKPRIDLPDYYMVDHQSSNID